MWLRFLFFLICCVSSRLIAIDVDLAAKVQYRSENIRWTLEGPPLFFSFITEQKWQNIQSPELLGQMVIYPFSNIDLTGCECDISQCYINLQGGVIPCVFFNSQSNNRLVVPLNENAIVMNKTQKNSLFGWDGSIEVGCKILQCRCLAFYLDGGYSWQCRVLHSHPMVFVSQGTGDIANLTVDHLQYKSFWKGPWIGICAYLTTGCNWVIGAHFEFHSGILQNRNQWQEQEQLADLFSFENDTHIHHKSKYYGYKGILECEYHLNKRLCLGANIQYDYFFQANGEADIENNETIFTPLGKVIGQSTLTLQRDYHATLSALAITFAASYNF